jgi:hypothetical protein
MHILQVRNELYRTLIGDRNVSAGAKRMITERLDRGKARDTTDRTIPGQQQAGVEAIQAGNRDANDDVKQKLLKYLSEKHKGRFRNISEAEIAARVLSDKGKGAVMTGFQRFGAPAARGGAAFLLTTAGALLGGAGLKRGGALVGAGLAGPAGAVLGHVTGGAAASILNHLITRKGRELADAARVFNAIWDNPTEKAKLIAATTGTSNDAALEKIYKTHQRSKLWGALKFSAPLLGGLGFAAAVEHAPMGSSSPWSRESLKAVRDFYIKGMREALDTAGVDASTRSAARTFFNAILTKIK